MSDEKQPPAEAGKPQAAGPAPMILIAAVVGALVAGAAAGAFVVAPRFAPKADAQTAAHAPKKKAGKHGGAHGKGKSTVHRLENIIVNPAGSSGTRFVMATVAIEVEDEHTNDVLNDKDAQVRDAVTATLESQTLEMLTRAGARDSLKRRLETAIAPIVGADTDGFEVFLPQFVIQ